MGLAKNVDDKLRPLRCLCTCVKKVVNYSVWALAEMELKESSNGSAEAEASGEEASPRGPTKLRSASVSVLEPSASKVKGGKILPFSVGRTRSSSTRSSTSSTNRGWGKDVWIKAELFLTPLTLCYSIEGKGVSEAGQASRKYIPSGVGAKDQMCTLLLGEAT